MHMGQSQPIPVEDCIPTSIHLEMFTGTITLIQYAGKLHLQELTPYTESQIAVLHCTESTAKSAAVTRQAVVI